MNYVSTRLPAVRPVWRVLSFDSFSMKRIHVNTSSRRYEVLFERGLLPRLNAELARLPKHTGVFVLSSPRVWKHWGRAIQKGLRGADVRGHVLFNDAESAKNLRTYGRVCRELVRAGADRRAVLLAVGGGVVGDVAGFVAATYLRGVTLVHVPTTLVAQVDSAIGGKAGVNLPEGKNLVGVFYQPSLVLADPEVLTTLPPRQFRSGLHEVIKYGILGDAELFGYLEANLDGILRQSPVHLDWVIPRCIAAKARIVARDEREGGAREALNLGHTFAHALETATRYRVFLHGEAVGWGLIAAARRALRSNLLAVNAAKRIIEMVLRVGPLPPWPAARAEALVEIMRTDKKARGGKLRFVLPTQIGKVKLGVEAPESAVRQTLREMAAGRFAS